MTKRMLLGYEIFYNNEDAWKRGADDSLYTILVKLNGFSHIPCSDYMLGSGTPHVFNNNFNTVSPFKNMGVFKKNGYCAQNTYITWLLYCNIAKQNTCQYWDKDVHAKISRYRRLPEYETGDFAQ